MSSETISHLEASVEGMKIQQSKLQVLKIYECKLYALLKI